MLIISPRSYVTAAFDSLFPALIGHVFDTLSPVGNWWPNLVCKNKNMLFKDDEIYKMVSVDDVPDCYAALFDYFDEYSLCSLVLNYSSMHFCDKDLYRFRKLRKIRNEWAHRNYNDDYRRAAVYDDEGSKRKWAITSILDIRGVAHHFKEVDIEKSISILLFKMKSDWIGIEEGTELPDHDKLLEWLYENVVQQVVDDESPVKSDTKDRVNRSFNNLIDFANVASPKTASRYVVDYYWNAIKAKTDIYDEIKKHKDIPTFEDVVEKFTEYCYGK